MLCLISMLQSAICSVMMMCSAICSFMMMCSAMCLFTVLHWRTNSAFVVVMCPTV